MRTFDLSPLFRSSVGFDRLADTLDWASRLDSGSSYPPYNIEKLGDDDYRIVMAVAGFSEDDLEITAQGNTLTIQGKTQTETKQSEDVTFLHRGIAGRSFERRFELADHIQVTGAELKNGLLAVSLVRELPEAAKPRTIAIGHADNRVASIEHASHGADKAA